MINIAITGGIASGKTQVTNYLISKGYTVVDADRMSREMTAPGGKAMPYILEHFGPSFILEDGSLDRAAMRDLVFRDPSWKSVLEEGTTKVVLEDIEAIKKERAASGDKVLFFDIPLLFETGSEDDYDAVWVVTADYEIRKRRIMERDGIDDSLIDLIMDSQEGEEKKVRLADNVIYNNGTLDELRESVDRTLKSYGLQ
ncbi:MAG: dephospho-CoA kinase [Mogibacterium sp.]|nr:dephospho-CoA kinase [Mogibacterium sp.]MBR4092031.1 dephospho-CoA kinase [Mogibacterium sp.]